jgi:DNA-nicking Smr family endonuclease
MPIKDSEEDPIEYPITSEIDLHTFRPNEVSSLLREYIKECRERGIFEIRVIHGKGTGTLREGVHRLLDQMHNEVHSYRLGDETSGSWGATLVTLNRL